MPTRIEWTDESWNPITGCSQISEGCQNCYAKRMANRLKGRYGYPADEPFRVTMHRDRLHIPSDWKKPKRIFVSSMGDIFHNDVEWNWQFSIFQITASLKRHTFLFLTKRPGNAYKFLTGDGGFHLQRQGLGEWPFYNIWIGVSAENQKRYMERWLIAQDIPAAKLFISFEPLLGPIRFMNGMLPDWCIMGSETGAGARPMQPEWAIDLYDQCKAAGIPFFFKKESKGLPVPDHIKVREYPK